MRWGRGVRGEGRREEGATRGDGSDEGEEEKEGRKEGRKDGRKDGREKKRRTGDLCRPVPVRESARGSEAQACELD